MKKLYRSAMFAGVLAFGVAACGDDVTIVEPEPTPPPPLSVSLTPSNSTVTVGEVADFAVGVSGGADGAQASWTCSSSSSAVASVATTQTGCRATGVAAGSASITVTVTKGAQSANAGAQLVVNAPPVEPEDPEAVPATVSIASVTQGGLTTPVNIDNVAGQIDVTLNVNPNDQTITRVEVLVGDKVAAGQNIAANFEFTEEDGIAEALQLITLSFNTAAYTVDAEARTATPLYANGPQIISARIFTSQAPDSPRASEDFSVTFNNNDGFHVLATATGNTAVDADGLFWRGGPQFALTMSPIPVMYSGRTVTTMTAGVRVLGTPAGVSTLERCVGTNLANRDISAGGSALDFAFTCAGAEAENFVPYVTTLVDPGEPGPAIEGTTLQTYAGVLNLAASQDHPFPARIDVRAPQQASAGAAMRIVSQTGATGQTGPAIFNTGNWLNAEYRFCNGFDRTVVSDNGVGWVSPSSNCGASPAVTFAVSTGATVATAVAGPAADLRGSAVPNESITNTAFRAWAFVEDRLGNLGTFIQGGNPAGGHAAVTFGYDNTAPTLALETDSATVGIFSERYSVVNTTNAGDRIVLRATDIASGFTTAQAVRHGVVSVRGAFESATGATDRANVVPATGNPAANTFATARAGNPINALAALPGGAVTFGTQTALDAEFNLGTALSGAAARYYVYQVQIRDQAGNVTREYRAVYVNNNSQPRIENLTRPTAFSPNAAFNVGMVVDSVEVLEGSLELRYPNTGGTIVWERPTSDLTSVLRMNANILDGELFNDVIYRPQMDVAFPLGLGDLGLPFIRSIQTLTAGSINTSRPDSVRARIFSGYGVVNQDLNHSSAIPASGGISPYVARTIPDEAVSLTGAVNYATLFSTAGASFEIVGSNDPGVADCNAEFCIRAIGPLSTWTDPFQGGAVIVLWADDAGTGVGGELQWRVAGVATPNFSNGFPTRDSGSDRIYEWEFNLSGANPGDLLGGLALAAAGIRPTGDALLTAYAPAPFFNVVFDGGPFTITAGDPATLLPVILGPNSTVGAYSVQCFFTNDDGDEIAFAPIGSGLTLATVGQSCSIAAAGAAPAGTYQILAVATQGAEEARTVTTVTVERPVFGITIAQAPAALDIPLQGDPNTTQSYLITPVNGTINDAVCSVSPSGAGVTAVFDGTDSCDVEVAFGATVNGTYTVSAIAQSDLGEQSAPASVTFVAERQWNVTLPASTTLAPASVFDAAGQDIAVSLAGPGGLGISTLTCSIVGGATGFTVTAVGTTDCNIVVNPNTFVPGSYTLQATGTLTSGESYTATGTVVIAALDPFNPTVDIATAPDNRREIERDRTANFVIDDETTGIGIDGAVITVSPDAQGVTAILTDDGAGTDLIQVTVGAAATTGLYSITVVYTELTTGRVHTDVIYIRVIDTGTVVVGGE